MWARLLSILLGVWLMAAPAVLGYNGPASTNDRIVGPLAIASAGIAIPEVTRPVRWVNFGLGLWLIIAPWVLGFEPPALLNSLGVGVLLMALAAVRGPITARFGGGWSALWRSSEAEAETEAASAASEHPNRARSTMEHSARSNGPADSRPEVVVVTGASAGVGRATVRAFAQRQAKIGLLARGRAGLDAARREVEEAGGQALILPTDVANFEQVEAAAQAVEDAFGPIDIWVNNAMQSVFSPIKEMTPQDYRRVTEVTYLGYVHGTLAALKRMLPRDRGVIVQVGSALAYRGIPLQSAYCAAKHAIEGFNDSLRSELIHDNSRVRVTSVHLPALNTPQFRWVKSRLPKKSQPVPPIFQPEVAAEAIVWAAHHDRRELIVGFPVLKVIWGHTFFPGYADRKLGREGYEQQQIDEPRDPDRPHNLDEPVDQDEDYGARGVFDDRARDRSVHFWLTTHRGPVALAAAGIVGLMALVAAVLVAG